MPGINHTPKGPVGKIEEKFSNEYEAFVTFVCTTEITPKESLVADLYYSDKPIKEYNTNYFVVYIDRKTNQPVVKGVPFAESLPFVMVQDKLGGWHYSQHRSHKNIVEDGVMIKGGRFNPEAEGFVSEFKLIDGFLERIDDEGNIIHDDE